MPDDSIGHRLRPFAMADVVGPEFSVDYRIDGHGLRDEVDHPWPNPEGTTRILVLGDSFAFGSGNAYQESWPALLEGRLLADGYPVEVVKAAVPGYDTRAEALYLESVFDDFDPDVVLLTFLPNDLFTNRPIEADGEDLDQEEFPVLARGDKRSSLHSLILLKRLLTAHDSIYVRLYALTKRFEYFVDPPTATVRRQIEVTKALLERVQGFCRQRDRDLIVLSVPQQFQVLAPERDERLGINVHVIDQIFGEFARDRGFAWLAALPSLRKTYRANAGDLYFRFDGHLNRLGNAALTDYLASALRAHLGEGLQRQETVPPGSV